MSKDQLSDVDTKWTPPEDTFTKSAKEIAQVLHDNSKDLKQAMARLNFYINRGGDDVPNKDNLEKTKEELRKLYNMENYCKVAKYAGKVDNFAVRGDPEFVYIQIPGFSSDYYKKLNAPGFPSKYELVDSNIIRILSEDFPKWRSILNKKRQSWKKLTRKELKESNTSNFCSIKSPTEFIAKYVSKIQNFALNRHDPFSWVKYSETNYGYGNNIVQFIIEKSDSGNWNIRLNYKDRFGDLGEFKTLNSAKKFVSELSDDIRKSYR